MYRLLLVEDELSTRRWLSQKIEWDKFGFQLVGVAEDGETAWGILQNDNCIDVIMTDIRMRQMDGLELISRIREAGLVIELVISSGYGEFNYAQQAIKLGVSVYLLKPITREQLELEFKCLKMTLDEKHLQKNELLRAKSLKREKENLTKKEWFQRCLLKEENVPGLAESLEKFDSRFVSSSYMTLVAAIDDYHQFNLTYNAIDQKLCKFIVMNILSEITYSFQGLESVLLSDNEYVFFIPVEPSDELAAERTQLIGSLFQQALKKYLKIFNITISVGGSRPVCGPEELVCSYRQALKSLRNKFFLGTLSIISHNERIGWNEECHYSLALEKKLTVALKKNDTDAAFMVIDDLFSLYKEQGTIEGIRWITGELLVNIYKELTDIKSIVVSSEVLRKMQNELMYVETLVELHEKTREAILLIVNLMQMESMGLGPIAKGIEYVKLNLDKDMSLQEVAKYAGISPSYFSTQFKQEQGQNFIKYMVALRMEKARGLLEQTRLTIIEIGEQVGYHSYRYFTRVFKEQFGITPSEYRGQIFMKSNNTRKRWNE
jgi:two-component system response regulator YesN